MHWLLKMGIFHCYVSLPEGTAQRKINKTGQFFTAGTPWFQWLPTSFLVLRVPRCTAGCIKLQRWGPSQTNSQAGRFAPENRHAFHQKRPGIIVSPINHPFFRGARAAVCLVYCTFLCIYLGKTLERITLQKNHTGNLWVDFKC